MTETVEQTDGEPPAGKKLGRRTIVVVVAAAVLVLGGVGAGIYFLTRGDDNPAAGPSGGTGTGSTASAPPSGSASGPAPAQPGSGGGGAEAGTVKTVAQQAITAINAGDATAMRKISCDPDTLGQETPPEAKAELVAEPQLTGDTATVELKVTIGDQSTTTLVLPLRKQNGTWCVD